MIKVNVFAGSELAMEIGINAAVVVNKLDFWIQESEYGVHKNGLKYIYNTYEQWREQLPWLTTKTIKRIFKKLVDLGIFIKEKFGKGYDHRQMWSIDYDHPIVKKCPRRKGQNVPIERDKMSLPYNTDTTKEKQQRHTLVGKVTSPSDRDSYHKGTRTKWGKKENKASPASRKDWPEVEQWEREKPPDYRSQLQKYVDNAVNNPKHKVEYPVQYRMGVTYKVWHDEKYGTSLSSFKYIDKTDLHKNDHRPTIRVLKETDEQRLMRVHKAPISFDAEMELRQEELYG